jgi:hypothetical protein
MIISDLQYVESATETEVKGGGCWCYEKRSYNVADAGALAEAFGRNTKAFSYARTLTIEGNYSGAASGSYSESY